MLEYRKYLIFYFSKLLNGHVKIKEFVIYSYLAVSDLLLIYCARIAVLEL